MSDPTAGPLPDEPAANTPGDRADVLQQTWQALTAGRVVALPTETGYVLAAHLGQPAALARLAALLPAARRFLGVRSASDARLLLPSLAPVGLRLARRFWPGPLLLEVPGAKNAVAAQLPAEVFDAAGTLRLRLPGSDLLVHLLPVLGGPVLLAEVPEPPAGTPEEQCSGEAILKGLGVQADLLVEEGPRPPRPRPTTVAVLGEHWHVVGEGVLTRDALERSLVTVVVFVCTGNTCRSPLAEALFKKRLADRLGCPVADLQGRGFFVLSAGLAAMMKQAAAEEAVAVAQAHGADLTGHASRPLTEDLTGQADFLFAMTRGHLAGLEDAYPRLGTVPRLVRADGVDVADPIGQSLEVYEECARQLSQALEPLVEEVLAAAVFHGKDPLAGRREGQS